MSQWFSILITVLQQIEKKNLSQQIITGVTTNWTEIMKKELYEILSIKVNKESKCINFLS